MEVAIIGLLSAGTAIGATAAYQQGRAAKQQAANEAAINEYNARIAGQQAEYESAIALRQAEEERLKAEEEARKQEREGEELIARQKALYGKSGVLMRGSPLSVIEDTAFNLEYDRQMILREGRIATGYYSSLASAKKNFGAMEANIYRMKASSTRQYGRSAARGATLSAAGTLLTGAGSIGLAKYEMGNWGSSRGLSNEAKATLLKY